MPNTEGKSQTAKGKRLVLIVDDEEINRTLLNVVLKDTYETIFASNGEDALRTIRGLHDELSLVLLDLLMPGMHGLDLMKILKNDQDLKDIPVIVLTADQEAEVSSLQLGAADFIPKPYPRPEVILARVLRCIELYEGRKIILSTERDSLTGLYNREYFFRYAERFDRHHKNKDMDAIVIDIRHFRMLNERYGRSYGDEVLRHIGMRVREMVQGEGGIVCRREADTFFVYCPHRNDYQAIIDHASEGLADTPASSSRVRLRMGVYAHADKTIDLARRFDRAKMASDTVRDTYIKNIALYDKELHESEVFAEQLLEDFQDALTDRQFAVYYQPKFDVRPETPVLASSEALVRWRHPKFGMISPGVFIPLFEGNGMIQQLDLYVWKEAARQIRDWRDRLGITVPVSVNVSRIDMYDPNLIATFQQILQEHEIHADELLLEITESAYTQDSSQITSTVSNLRDLGFRVEMDDFGTGYSSLNMISSLPIDALKLDMDFIRAAFREGGDTGLIEVIIDIADYLGVPVIAEGIETEEQLMALRAMGCDLVQGYYFSQPVPPESFEPFLNEEKQRRSASPEAGELQPYEAQPRGVKAGDDRHPVIGISNASSQVEQEQEYKASAQNSLMYASIAQALAADYFSIYYVDVETDDFVEFSSDEDYDELGIEKGGKDFFNLSRKNILRVVHHDDHDKILSVFTKERLLSEMEQTGMFTLTYRLLLGEEPTYVSMKATRMANDERHIVIGVNNVDAQMKRDHELNAARERANLDALTGVKSKHAYNEMVADFNIQIASGAVKLFAVVVCGVNGLKAVNDTQGHQAGDKLILDATRVICDTFKNSPVYRVGGDEFVAVLRGPDYDNRDELISDMTTENLCRKNEGGVVIACGDSAWRPGRDDRFEEVFDRADTAMRKNKAELKR